VCSAWDRVLTDNRPIEEYIYLPWVSVYGRIKHVTGLAQIRIKHKGESTTAMQVRWVRLYADRCGRDYAPHTRGGCVRRAHTTFFFFL
jgi:hypothetical protein